jgi:aminoglycoside phosphotransferase (APT) family kinase protein
MHMTDADAVNSALPAPRTLDGAMDPAWLSKALAPITGGATITSVEVGEVLRTMATKVRFRVTWAGGEASLCLKAFLDVDAGSAGGSSSTITEADFYTELAPALNVRVPKCVATVIDRPGAHGFIIMRDLVVDGARFCSALEPLVADQAAASLDQLARLHGGADLAARTPWLAHRISDLAHGGFMSQAALQGLLDDPRGVTLDPAVRDAGRLLAGVKALAARDAALPASLVHGDCHAGNLYETADGPGLIDWQLLQRGGWALDVAYHIATVLPVKVAEAEEWRLLKDYLERARSYGAPVPDFEEARAQYRAATVWGYFLWGITRRVQREIINAFVERLGASVARHDSFRLLGV